jgi:hypothetical protein
MPLSPPREPPLLEPPLLELPRPELPLLEVPLLELPLLELPLLELPLLEPPASPLMFTVSMPPQAARHTPAASIARVRPLMTSRVKKARPH